MTTALQQRSAAWHAARRGKLTASNLGAAMGQVSYVSRKQAFLRATGQEEFVGNVACDWGTANEANGIMEYQALTGNVVQATGLHIHPTYNWMAGSPDGFVGNEGMIEVKCPYYRRKDGSRAHATVPGHYYMQMNALLEITERAWCDYVCWTPETVKIYRVYRNSQFFEAMLPFYSQFYAAMSIHATSPPPISKSELTMINETVSDAITNSVDLKFWNLADSADLPPSSDLMDEDADEIQATGCKRGRLC